MHRSLLSDRARRKLQDWILKHSAEIESKEHTLPQLASRAQKELGFPVSPSNVKTAARVVDVTIKPAGKANIKALHGVSARLSALEAWAAANGYKGATP